MPSRFMPSSLILLCAASLASWLTVPSALAKQNIRDAFFEVYPQAVGSVLDTVPSTPQPQHCGVCHYDFGGGGPRNPYGSALETALESFPNNPQGRRDAVVSIQDDDPDTDGYSSLTEISDILNFLNTPTFPGLTPANVGSVSNVDSAEISDHLVPSSGGDTTPPDVLVEAPAADDILTANAPTTVEWTASDPSGVVGVSLYVSDDAGASFRPVATNLQNTGTHTWFPANRPTATAVLRVEAVDGASNVGHADSDVFTIVSPAGGLVGSTLRDFDQPGSQPFDVSPLNDPAGCSFCHGNYDTAAEPYFNWQGSMMAYASYDPLFEAAMVIGNQDAPDSGDLCLRCHIAAGWLFGRSVPTDGSQMLTDDRTGVSCDLCHRLVDPIYDPGNNPLEDQSILNALAQAPDEFGNGMYVVDPIANRRGPFEDATTGHPILVSPFHREAALCGTCHDVSNPAFENDGSGQFVANAMDTPAADFSAHSLMPLERTYSEWFYSAYNTPEGIFAPEFGGNLDFVSSCQDCHMRDITGQGCNFGTPPVRDDLPLHDMTGGSTWLTPLMSTLYPGLFDPAALQAGAERARYMLQNAADLDGVQTGLELEVTVTNQTGHKLPTGYPEGRRVWLNVQFRDVTDALIAESGAYDSVTAELTSDPEIKVYEAKPGLSDDLAAALGLPAGPSFHFVLSNQIYKDNRIPPRGFTNAEFEAFGGGPVAATYADGQHWDVTTYQIPAGAASADVTLFYQSTTKEYVEFLRDQNVTDASGQLMYDLWNDNSRCPPENMRSTTIPVCAAPCSDDDACTVNDNCAGSLCGGEAVDCSLAGDDCNAAQCDPGGTEGNCAALTPINEGGPCAGGSGECNQGLCMPTGACVTSSDCADLDEDGTRDDPCVWWSCASGECDSLPIAFADMGGAFGDCVPDAAVDGHDRFHALNCFSNSDTAGVTPYPCEDNPPFAFAADGGGTFGSCVPDGVCDGHDAFHALNSFEGASTCVCSGPAPAPPRSKLPAVAASTTLTLTPANRQCTAGGDIEVHVFLDEPLQDLRGYQLHIDVSGGGRGTLELKDISVLPRGDHVYAGESPWQAMNVRTRQVLAGLDTAGVASQGSAYLATFRLRASNDARGTFVVDLLHQETNHKHRTFLFPTAPHRRIEITDTHAAVITVGARRGRLLSQVRR